MQCQSKGTLLKLDKIITIVDYGAMKKSDIAKHYNIVPNTPLFIQKKFCKTGDYNVKELGNILKLMNYLKLMNHFSVFFQIMCFN